MDENQVRDWVKGSLVLVAMGSPHEIETEVENIEVECEETYDGLILRAEDGSKYKISVHKI